MIRALSLGMSAVLVALVVGCGSQQESKSGAMDSAYLLSAEPAGARGVIDARKEAKDGEPVVLVGRIGGEAQPWVAGVAAFRVVDSAARSCNEIEGDTCPTPWDYCCEPDLSAKTALVKIVDAGGKLVRRDARELLGVKELQTVVVQGVARRDKDNNLTVEARGVYVKK